MKILIATGIYPPKTSGPAQYAYMMKTLWEKMGHKVVVKTYGFEHKLPTGIRHLYYLLRIIPTVVTSDFVFALDTYSVGFPAALATKVFRKKLLLRTGGDFLWEGYVERTHDLVLLRRFYEEKMSLMSFKERMIFTITKWTLHQVSLLIFSTEWQKDIWMKPYGLHHVRTTVVENHYDAKEPSYPPTRKNFVAGARPLKWKNAEILAQVFSSPEIIEVQATYERETCGFDEFMEKIAHAYATLLVSLGDISPHMILDSIRHNKPFIVTEENGLMNRIAPIAITVNPLDTEDVKSKIVWLCKKENYDMQVEKIRQFNHIHTWEDISREILNLYRKL